MDVVTKRGPWASVDKARLMYDPLYGVYDSDHFAQDNTGVASLYTQSSDGGTNGLLTTQYGGVFDIITDTTDNNETELERGAGSAGVFVATVNSQRKLIFEARVRIVTLTDLAVFIGVGEPGLAAGDFQTDDSGALADKDYIGFHILTATPTEIDCVYNLSGGTAQEPQGNAYTSAAAWRRYGFVFDGINTIRYYVDDAEVGMKASVGTTNFPSGEEMNPIFAIKTGSSAAVEMQIDWWECAMITELSDGRAV